MKSVLDESWAGLWSDTSEYFLFCVMYCILYYFRLVWAKEVAQTLGGWAFDSK